MSSRHRENLFPPYIFLLAVAALLMFADTRRWVDPVRRRIERIILPIRVAEEETKDETVQQLKAAVAGLEKTRDDLSEENELLRKQLQAPLPPQYDFTPAYIVSVEQNEKEKLMHIAAGSDTGVAEGMPVVIESVLVGVIIRVTPNIATVRLLGSPETIVAVRTASGSTGLVKGVDNDVLTVAELDHILQTDELVGDERVATSGEGGLPPNLLIGSVGGIISEAREPFQRAEVELSVDPKQLRKVFVITKW
ncbi:MAG TPA: rod shape-determining protein MreC [Patescibacteria group bacterium]|nr:rod shape-determining protein MreC [Patescibacteria group bacterium]